MKIYKTIHFNDIHKWKRVLPPEIKTILINDAKCVGTPGSHRSKLMNKINSMISLQKSLESKYSVFFGKLF